MRKSGILLHISSLPSNYGIGTLGKEAYKFVDFLEKSGQKLWQVLPVGHTSYGDSPYQSYSSYGGNPYFIDLDFLIEEQLIDDSDVYIIPREMDKSRVDYKSLYETRFVILKKAADKFLSKPTGDYFEFLAESSFWLEDYATFMALKERMHQRGRSDWDINLRFKNTAVDVDAETVNQYKVMQYLFFKQWFKLKEYANHKGIEIIGDLPIYCACDSSDVWANPEVFVLDEEFRPSLVAGCPPDGFSPLGQRWGNPLYNWEYLYKTDYKWWTDRLKYALKMFDTVRIDHFRGFDSYFAIDAEEETAVNGRWIEGPKMKLFDAFRNVLGDNLPIIAEDLGFLTQSVKELLQSTGYPGMKLLQFAFESREAGDYLPHNYPKHSVCYVGTHDNDTAIGWFENCGNEDRERAKEYFNLTEEEGISYGLIRGAMSSVSDVCIICIQDYLSLGSEGRMNTPSTQSGNWQWRMKASDITDDLAEKIKNITRLYGRVN